MPKETGVINNNIFYGIYDLKLNHNSLLLQMRKAKKVD